MTSEVFGRPIKGTIRPTGKNEQEQKNPMELIDALDELLAHPGVIHFKWTQYTPYWNDGEECEFHVLTDWQAGVKLEFGSEDAGEAYDGHYTYYDLQRIDEINGVNVTELYPKVVAVSGALGSGSHYVWLNDTFGDHASVFATKNGFEVEFYQHD